MDELHGAVDGVAVGGAPPGRFPEGGLAPVACLECGAKPCPRAAECRTLPMWKKYYAMTNEFFDGISIADLMKNGASYDYVI